MIEEKKIFKLFNFIEIETEVKKEIEKLRQQKSIRELESILQTYQQRRSQLEKKLGVKLSRPLTLENKFAGEFIRIYFMHQTLKDIVYQIRNAIKKAASTPKAPTTNTNNSNSNIAPVEEELFELNPEEMKNFRDDTQQEILKNVQMKPNSEIKEILDSKKKEYKNLLENIISPTPQTPSLSAFEIIIKNFQLKFEIDVLEQYLFRKIITLEDQEKIREEIFTNANIQDIISDLELAQKSKPTTLKSKIQCYCQYKYLIEFLEYQLERESEISFTRRQELIASIEQLEFDADKFLSEIKILSNALSNPNIQVFRDLLGTEFDEKNPLNIQPLQESLYAYNLVYYKKLFASQNVDEMINQATVTPFRTSTSYSNLNDNNAIPTLQGKNPNGFHHHSQHELAQINLQKEAHELFEKGVRLNQQLANMSEDDPTAQKIYNEAREALTNAVAKGSADAERYLQNMFCSTIMRFGF